MSLFIVVEGLDGLGKSTLARALAEVTNARLINTPGLLKPYLNGFADDVPETDRYKVFLADRLLTYHTQIAPTLTAGQHVVCDRYNLSNYAYQGQAVGRERVLEDASYPPHLMLYLEGHLDLALQRRQLRLEPSQTPDGLSLRYEDPTRLRATKAMYDEAIRKSCTVFCDDIEVISASLDRAEMLSQSVKAFNECLLMHDPNSHAEIMAINSRMYSLIARWEQETNDNNS